MTITEMILAAGEDAPCAAPGRRSVMSDPDSHHIRHCLKHANLLFAGLLLKLPLMQMSCFGAVSLKTARIPTLNAAFRWH
jgi:hypothetical protein